MDQRFFSSLISVKKKLTQIKAEKARRSIGSNPQVISFLFAPEVRYC